MTIRALTFLLCCIATAPLYGMKKVTFADEAPADANGLSELIDAYDNEWLFNAQALWAHKILGYKKEAFVAVGQKKFDSAYDALVTLNGSIDDETKTCDKQLHNNPYKKQLWGFGSVAAILGATLFAWRKPLFIPRFLGFLSTATGFGIYAAAELSRYSFVRSKLESLETLQTSVNTWINAPSPFQTTLDQSGEIQTGNMYPNVDKQQ